jgi:serine/threonine protein kinase
LRHKLIRANASSNQKSHTALWEEELSSHFAATNFVPLPTGKTMQFQGIKVISQLASGGMSAIYLAERAGKLVVLKESVLPLLTDEKMKAKARELFRREAVLQMRLDHPRIAKLHDHFVENERDYLVLEYVPGKTLREHGLASGPQNEDTVLDIARQICEILVYLHGQDPPVIHRDLTPDNLVITPDGRVFLIDFGAANQFVGTATGTIIGKQVYIAPEQFRGKATCSSDIYSLGVTLYFLLTGKEPGALSVSHPRHERPELSGAVDELVASCTQLESVDRPATAANILDRIAHLHEDPNGVGRICVPEDKGTVISLHETKVEILHELTR